MSVQQKLKKLNRRKSRKELQKRNEKIARRAAEREQIDAIVQQAAREWLEHVAALPTPEPKPELATRLVVPSDPGGTIVVDPPFNPNATQVPHDSGN